MNTAEIVVREVQGDSGFQVRKLFAKAECESRKAPRGVRQPVLHSLGMR